MIHRSRARSRIYRVKRVAAYGIALLLLGYTVLFAVSLYVVPDAQHVDVANPKEQLYYDSTHVVTYDIFRLLRSSAPKLIVLGASNAEMGFRPTELEALYPGYEVACVCIGGQNISDIRGTLSLLLGILPRDVVRKSAFIAGICEGLFQEQHHPLGDIGSILGKSFAFRLKDGEPQPLLSPSRMDLLVRALRPAFFVQYLHRKHRSKRYSSDLNKYSQPLSDEEKQFLYDTHNMGNPEPNIEAWSRDLVAMSQMIGQYGAELVFVDLPIPDWHKERSLRHREYQQHLDELLGPALNPPRVQYVSLLDIEWLSRDENFVDDIHPQNEVTRDWSRALRERWVPGG